MTSVDEDMNPVLVSNCKDDTEILTVQANLGDKKIRIINGYGPQEDDDIQDVLEFWQELEGEVISAKDEGCLILIEMNANAKVGNTIIKGDPHGMTNNGKLMRDVIERQGLTIANALDICKGIVTRERQFENKSEKSAIDYIVMCEELSKYITEMTIDEDRIHVLSRYIKRKTGNRIIKSDHNILLGKFSITFSRKSRKVRQQLFMFKCEESKQLFCEETNSTSKLSSCFHECKDISKCSNNFFKSLDGIFHKCFKKVRIRTGQKRNLGDQSIQEKLKTKAELKVLLMNTTCEIAQKEAKTKLEEIEEILIEETAEKNAKIVQEHVEAVETFDGVFSNLGFWKLKQKLRPVASEPPMAKVDQHGNIITSPEGIKDLYIEEYKNRLKNRKMKTELMDLYFLKTELWMSRLEYLKEKSQLLGTWRN